MILIVDKVTEAHQALKESMKMVGRECTIITVSPQGSQTDGVIGLDAKYGNHLFIQSGENGYLMKYDKEKDLTDQVDLVDRMAAKIVEIFADRERLETFHRKSYEIAEQYEESRVADKWIGLISCI